MTKFSSREIVLFGNFGSFGKVSDAFRNELILESISPLQGSRTVSKRFKRLKFDELRRDLGGNFGKTSKA